MRPFTLLFLPILFVSQLCAEPLSVFVSIPSQRYFVEQIGSDLVKVEVMVSPGQSPETYEPTPQQLARLSLAQIYFSIGLPFEDLWGRKFSTQNPDLRMVDLSSVITKRTIEPDEEHQHHSGLDPHVWTSPLLVKSMASLICAELSKLLPESSPVFEDNLKKFLGNLDKLDSELAEMLAPLKGRAIYVLHPAWGYFTDRYGLRQIAIEHEGKAPGARAMTELISQAKTDRVKAIFIQEQYSRKIAETIAKSLNARVVETDSLAYDYPASLRTVAKQFIEALK